jgi:hypothetical protein
MEDVVAGIFHIALGYSELECGLLTIGPSLRSWASTHVGSSRLPLLLRVNRAQHTYALLLNFALS